MASALPELTARIHLLSNGRLSTAFGEAGTGYTAFKGCALTRWVPDATRDAAGSFLYVRDLEDGTCWSAGHQPLQHPPERYEATLGVGRAEIMRRDDGVETRLEVCVVPDDDLELRRCTLTNHSGRLRRLELTSYVEVVLDDPLAYAGHPAFSKLFVQTEYLPDHHALLARRRLRSPDEEPIWLVHLLAEDGQKDAGLQFETDRARFVGRGRTPADPQALLPGARLSGTTGNVLDPIVSLRRVVALDPEASRRIVLGLGAGHSRAAVLALAQRYRDVEAAGRAFTRAAEYARRELRDLGLSEDRVPDLQRLTGALLYGRPGTGAPAEKVRVDEHDSGALARYGLSGELPLIVVHITGEEALEAVLMLLRAHAFWRRRGLFVELLLLIHGAGREGLRKAAERVVQAVPALWNQRGGVFLRHAGEMTDADRAQVHAFAHVVFREGRRGPARPRLRATVQDAKARRYTPALHRPVDTEPPNSMAEPLRLDNGYGGFTQDGSEYVIRLTPAESGLKRPPLPWINVIANEQAGFLATDSGAGFTWCLNSRLHRLTPWFNDPISDPHGEALYVRDEEAGVFWSPTPGPIPQRAAYEVRHGFGYTRYRHASHALEQEVLCYVPRHDPVRITRVRLTNRSERARSLTLFQYQAWVLGELPQHSTRFVSTEHDATTGAILAKNRAAGPFAGRVAFAAVSDGEGVHVTGDRAAFLGRFGSPARPAALGVAEPLDGRTGAGLDPCAAFQVPVELAPGETAEWTFLLGEADSRDAARDLIRRYRVPSAASRALEEVRAFWKHLLGAVEVETPAPEIDLMMGGWLLYQDLSCRLWGRSAFYQSGGAFGYRDQLQDSAALVYVRPDLVRRQILLHAAHQFTEGDVLHWWHPPTSHGLRTRFSDDLLWLPYVTAFYLATTGDRAILDEDIRFLTARPLEEGEAEAYLLPAEAVAPGTLYEHCCRALDRSLTRGSHGLPLMGTGDWNDGMNRVGREGRGESVWLGFFLFDILHDFIPVCTQRGDVERAGHYRAYRARLATALNDAGWDGNWYRRAFYDDGAPLGSADNDECRIDALAQAWAVISKAAPPARAEQALDAVLEQLVLEEAGLIRLLSPAFDRTPHDPGYIKGYLPGIRENGGQYTHGVLWVIRALAELGRGEEATRLMTMLSPVSHGCTPEAAAVYRVEPYVVAADVYGVPPHVGRGGWTWYTGSAGWMYRIVLESILGLRLVGGSRLALDPRISGAWPGFRLRYRLPEDGTAYEIQVDNPDGREQGVARATIDGQPADVTGGVARVPLWRDGVVHRVHIVLGDIP